MNPPTPENRRLVRLTEICRALPEAEAEFHGQHASFIVRGKKFAYYLHDHHGDGIIAVCFKTEPGQNELLLASEPVRFYRPAYIGPRGWVGLRLDLGEIDWAEVAEFVTDSYRIVAPKRLAAMLAEPADPDDNP
jgi:predicted DNA-binding protein (MmcQ/YjbR family)